MRVAIVTGGARGIGKGICIALAKEGCYVFVNYLNNKNEADEVVDEITRAGGKAQSLQADVSKPEEVKVLMKEASKITGSIEILVNNASLEINHYIWDLKDDEWEKSLRTTLFAPFYSSKYVLPYMSKAKNGKIVNISSIHDVVPRKAAVSYCSGKAGMLMMTKVLALELAPYNIQVNAVSPGLTLTDRTASILKDDGSVDVDNEVVASNPMKRPALIEEIVEPVLYLCSSKANYTSGTTIYVDGGYQHNLCPEREENMFDFLEDLKLTDS